MSVVSDDSIKSTDVENNANVEVSGVIEDGVDLALTRTDGQNNAVDVPVTENANGTWKAQIPVSDLAEGNNTLTASFSGLVTKTQTENVAKDTVAPALATASPAERLHRGNVNVALNPPAGESGAQIRYTVGNGDFPAPTATSGTVYNGPISLASSRTIKAMVIDSAGNPGGVAEFVYTIDREAPGIGANIRTGSYNTAQTLRLISAAQDLDSIRYTTNGATPNGGSRLYNAATGIPVPAGTRTIKAVAVDRAGNLSPVLERKITIRAATSTSLTMSTKAIKLRGTKVISGSVRPADSGNTVKLTIARPGADFVRNVPLFNGRFGYAYKATVAGTHRVSVSFAQDADSKGSTSATRSFRVVR